mgnify:CR=1 FL=1
MREIILDTETTGLSVKDGDRIIEVGCVELFNYIPTGKSLQFYCSTQKKINTTATNVHGLTNEFLDKHQSFEQQHQKLLDFIKDDTLVIHNAGFDIGFINHELKLLGREPLKNKSIDTVLLARKKLNTRIANLDYLCRRFSIDLSSRTLHGALLDCNLLAEVYIELMGGKQTTMQLSRQSKNTEAAKGLRSLRNTLIKKIEISEEEIKKHKSFVKKIKNSMWDKLDY